MQPCPPHGSPERGKWPAVPKLHTAQSKYRTVWYLHPTPSFTNSQLFANSMPLLTHIEEINYKPCKPKLGKHLPRSALRGLKGVQLPWSIIHKEALAK